MACEEALFDRNNLWKYKILFLFIGVMIAKCMNYFKFGKFMCARNVGEQAKVSFSG